MTSNPISSRNPVRLVPVRRNGFSRLPGRVACGCVFSILLGFISPAVAQWKMHVIDNSSRGADGVRLADFNGDSLPDVVTGWEEGGLIRAYQNPGPQKSTGKWPAVTVGRVKSPEDAFFADLDGDGNLDVVSCCEGRTKSVYVHWAPRDRDQYLQANRWTTEPFPAVANQAQWMFGLAANIDDQRGLDLVVGSKGKGACVGWLQSPENPRKLAEWKFHRLCPAGWIMSLRQFKWNDQTMLLVSDRKGSDRGVYLLHPQASVFDPWKRINVHQEQHEFMFLDFRQSSQSLQIHVATRGGKILRYATQAYPVFEKSEIPNPAGIAHGKAVVTGDIDLDGKLDLVHSSNTQSIARKKRISGLHWMKNENGKFVARQVAEATGRKYDRIELIDLDGDQDLDILTCEEAANLGVIWFENPTRN